MKTMKGLTILSLILCSSCSVVEQREFYVDTINTREEQIPCVLYHNDDILMNGSNEPIVTPARIKLDYNGNPSESRKIAVRAVKTNESGEIEGDFTESDSSPYLEDLRYLRRNDASKQIFMLRRNLAFEE